MIQIGQHSGEHGFDEPLGLLSDCHRRIERFLSVQVRISHEFHGASLPSEAVEATQRARQYFAKAAPWHVADEEHSLFPRLKAAAVEHGMTIEAIDRLESDHDTAASLHAIADTLLAQWIETGGLSESESDKLGNALRRLQEIYTEHIRHEDQELFPLAAKLLTNAQLAEVGEEMRKRRGITTPGVP